MKKLLVVATIAIMALLLTSCKDDSIEYSKYGDIEVEEIGTDALYDNYSDYTVIDIRESEEFNGWNVDGLSKNGHLEGAINFPTSLLDGGYDNNALLKTFNSVLGNRENIVIYGGDEEETTKTVGFLDFNKFENFKVYNQELSVLAEDSRFSFSTLENYEKLVSPRWVNKLINNEEVLNAPMDEYVILYANWGDEEQSGYLDGHIKGSFHMNTDNIEVVNPENNYELPPLWNLKTNEELIEVAKDYGIKKETTIILHSKDTTAATRVGFAFMYLGVEDVRIVDGGTEKYSKEFELETTPNKATAITETNLSLETVKTNLVVSTDEVKEKLNDGEYILASVRTEKEHNGETSGYNYVNSMGRIPGDTWVNSGDSSYDMNNYRMIDNTMISYPLLETKWSEYGLSEDNEISFYCGTGWRATEALFYAYLLGYENISLYDGGFLEWSDYLGNEIIGTLVPNE